MKFTSSTGDCHRDFKKYVNYIYYKITFTMEKGKCNQILFLDVLAKKGKRWSFRSLYLQIINTKTIQSAIIKNGYSNKIIQWCLKTFIMQG